MKLWHQSLAGHTESTPYDAMLRRVIDSACDPGRVYQRIVALCEE